MTTIQEAFTFRTILTDVEKLLREHASTTFTTTLVHKPNSTFTGEVVPIHDAAAIIARYIIGPTQR